MRSRVVPVPDSDAFLPGRTRHKIILDSEELLFAVRVDRVEELISRTLAESREHGTMLVFPWLVKLVKNAVLNALAEKLKKATENHRDLAVLILDQDIGRIEAAAAQAAEAPNPYWIGESSPLPTEW